MKIPIPGSMRNVRLDVDGWLSEAGLQDLDPFPLLLVMVAGETTVVVGVAEGGTDVVVGGAMTQATPSPLLREGLSGGSVCERMRSWTMSLRPTL